MRPIAILLISLFTALCTQGQSDGKSTHGINIGEEPITSHLVVNIPGDYPNLQYAVDALAGVRTGQGVRIILRIESGHRPATGLSVRDGDYSHFHIEAHDAIVTVSSDFSGAFILGENAVMPVLACLVDMDHQGGDGYSARSNSRGRVMRGCGVINAGSRGLYLTEASSVTANRSNFSGANSRTLWVTRGSTAHVQGSNLSDGLKGGRGPASAVSARRASVIDAQNANISNANGNAVSCDRASRINLQDANISGATGVALFSTRGSIISAGDSNLSDASSNAVRATEGAVVSVEGATIHNAGAHGIFASAGATVSASNAEITNSGSNGVLSTGGAVVTLTGATVTGSGADDLRIRQGGTIIASDTRTSNGTPSLTDTNATEFSKPGPDGIIYGP